MKKVKDRFEQKVCQRRDNQRNSKSKIEIKKLGTFLILILFEEVLNNEETHINSNKNASTLCFLAKQ